MWNPSDLLCRRASATRLLRAGAAVCALALSGPAMAQAPPPPSPGSPPAAAPSAGSLQDLRQVLEKTYEVLPLHNGVVLRPRQERLGVRTIEVSGGTIAVNGERVTEGVLRAWLATEADPVLRLYHLPPRERQALFGLQGGGGAPPAAAAPAVPGDETEIPAEGEIPAEAPDSDFPEPPLPAEAPEAPEAPDHGTSGSQVNFGNNIVVDKDELVEEAVAFVGSVRVEGEVSRDATALAGSVTVNGRVGGNVTAIGGDVHLGPHAVVDGDVTSVGGKIVRAEGAQVHGKTTEAGMTPPRRGWDDDDDGDIDIHLRPWSPFLTDSMDLVFQIVWVAILALLVCLCLLVARAPLEKVERHVVHEPWIAGLIGLAAQLLFAPLLAAVTILLVITIVGCALIALYPFIFIALLLAILLGYAAVAHAVGRFLEVRFNRRIGSPYMVALAGVLALSIWSLLGRLVGLGSGPIDFISYTILAFGFTVQYVAVTVGMGAVLRARFGGTPGSLPVAAVPPPPPAPEAPPAPPAPVFDDPALDGQPDETDPDRPLV